MNIQVLTLFNIDPLAGRYDINTFEN